MLLKRKKTRDAAVRSLLNYGAEMARGDEKVHTTLTIGKSKFKLQPLGTTEIGDGLRPTVPLEESK